jgi:hypothetical protein
MGLCGHYEGCWGGGVSGPDRARFGNDRGPCERSRHRNLSGSDLLVLADIVSSEPERV